ncbi:hypothetical protein [Bradyrhizobium stylosanthis]|uniref:Putative membrane protein n=1 Tax=Bradyrhizobium stylosanthis TaxID=1803665 RepID=A0A560DY12_9BRAD|nr:hypothetical protein [Bradyrhizobium stylosanthis]TWB01963.1 putative membrane protein [Bradyrhizobium stylosanthis]
MMECPYSVFSTFCAWTQYLPPVIQQITGSQIASFLFGVLVVVVFATDHYKVPTYAKTTVGEFIELAPESLTSHSRYMKGLAIYVGLMLGFYFILLAIGPTAIAPVLSYIPGGSDGKIDNSVWPLAATSIITLIGSRDDDKYLGRMEGWLRSIAHEAAYIPYAVTNLAVALDGSFPLTDEELRAAGELSPATQALIEESQEGSRQNWIRAKFLYSRLELLRDRDDQFKPVMRQPENERAFGFVREQREALTKELDRGDLGEDVSRKIDAFKNALAVFLASILWRACENETAVNAKLRSIRLNVSTPAPRSPATFIFHLAFYLGGVASVFLILMKVRAMQFQDESVQQKWHLTLAFLVFLLTAFFVTRWREKRLASGDWKYSSDVIIRCAILNTIAITIISALVTFAVHQGGSGRFYAMLLMAFGIALPSTLLFQMLMRWAASSPPTEEAVAATVGYRTNRVELLKMTFYAGGSYSIIAFVFAFVLYWPSDYTIVSSTPLQYVESALITLGNIDKVNQDKRDEDSWFRTSVSQASVRNLETALQNVRANILKGDKSVYEPEALSAIVTECDTMGDLGGGRQLFKPGCELGGFLSTLSKGEVMSNLYVLQMQIASMKPAFAALQNYRKLSNAVDLQWPNALLASLMWAVMAGVFAVSALLYRRRELWDGLSPRKLPDFVPEDRQERETWLRTPLYDLAKLSPLEALRYPTFRARLADNMSTQPSIQPSVPHLRTVA